MTIKQLAKELNVSPQAVYQRLQSRKIDVKKLTNPATKELTSDGEFVIRQMYSQENNQGVNKALAGNQSRQDERDKELEELRKQVAVLIEKNSSLEKRVDELKEERDEFREAMKTSQRLQEQLMNRFLPAAGETSEAKQKPGEAQPGGGAGKRSLWQRITGKGKP